MSANHDLQSNRAGRRPRGARPSTTNLDAAVRGWGQAMPGWVSLLASACDRSTQRAVADRLGRSGSTISKVINNNYPGDMAEAEQLVRGAYGNEGVLCPIWGPMPLQNCMRLRRRRGLPTNHMQRLHHRHCPTCPNNSDHAVEEDEL